MQEKSKLRMRMAAGVVLLYLLVSLKADYKIAAWFIACGVIGYLNGFVVGPSLVSFARKRKIRRGEVVLSVLAVVCSALLVFMGYGAPLLICTLSFLLIYWTVALFG